MKEQEQLDILASDVKLVDSTLREPMQGGIKLTLPGVVMPDGADCVVTYDAPVLNREVLVAWCDHVRRTWSARKNRQEAEAHSRAEGAGRVGRGPDANAQEPARGNGPNEANGADSEASVEDVIEAQVARLSKSVESYRQIRDAAADAYRSAEARWERAVTDLERARSALSYIRGLTSEPQGSRADSKQSGGSEEGKGGKVRRRVVATEVPDDNGEGLLTSSGDPDTT